MSNYDSPGFMSRLPGLDMDAHDGAMTATGSSPSRTPSPDNAVPAAQTGIPNVGTVMSLSAQTGPGEGASPNQPGQNDLGLPGASSDAGYADTGAGSGHNFTDQRRYDWQSKPGRNG